MSSNISYNVGGSIFQVRRSLLDGFPSTLLARSASEEWHDDKSHNEPIFIDRDAGRFRYCLDFMRDGKVHLPRTESKDALLKDLEYYGFQAVDPASIVVDLPVSEVVKCLATMEDEIATAEEAHFHMKLAHACFGFVIKARKSPGTFVEIYSDHLPNSLKAEFLSKFSNYNIKIDLLNEHLNKYKLRAVNLIENKMTLRVEVL